MAATGISVTDDVAAKFDDIKLGRIKARYVIYKIEGEYCRNVSRPHYYALYHAFIISFNVAKRVYHRCPDINNTLLRLFH